MFSSNKSDKRPLPDVTSTVIDETAVIESATFQSDGNVRIDGHYYGEMTVKGSVVIGEKGKVQGNMVVKSITVAGIVEGNISCDDDVHFVSTAKVNGNVLAKSFVVDEGASFNGNCSMSRAINGPVDKSLPIELKKIEA